LSRSYIASKIDALAARLSIMAYAGGYDFTDQQLRKEAARQIAQEQREQRASRLAAPPPTGRVTLDNVKALFAARVAAIAARMRDPRTQPPVTLDATARPSPDNRLAGETRDRWRPAFRLSEAQPSPSPVSPSPQHPGVFSGHPSAAQLIDDREFHNSVRYGDTATDNWRKSIQQNEELQQRRSRWIG
jgi:hypothetical protein